MEPKPIQKSFINDASHPKNTEFTLPNGRIEDQQFISNLPPRDQKLVRAAMEDEINRDKTAQEIYVAITDEGQDHSYEGKPFAKES